MELKIIDISMKISQNMIVYKNKEEKKPIFKVDSNFKNSTAYETSICMNLHTGTHLDMPLHMIEDGKTSEYLNLNNLVTNCKVFDLTNLKDSIDFESIKDFDINKSDFILFKTKNSYKTEFDFNFVYLAKDAAKYLAEKNIKGVGIDALGIERNQTNHPTHKELLSKDIIIIEGLNLKNVDQGEYKLIALPLNIESVEALPLRAILIKK